MFKKNYDISFTKLKVYIYYSESLSLKHVQGSRIVHFTLVGWNKLGHFKILIKYRKLLNHAVEINIPHTDRPHRTRDTQKPYRMTDPRGNLDGFERAI